MKVNKVQTNNYQSAQFKANIIETSSLKNLKAGLKPQEELALNSYIETIKNAKSKTNYIFDYMTIYSTPTKIRKLATISIQNKDLTLKHPPVFAGPVENSMDLFKNLADSLKI